MNGDRNPAQDIQPATDKNPLHRAAQDGNIDRAMQLLYSRPLFEYGVNSTDSKGQTPLFYACSEGHEEMVRMLVSEFNADVSVQDSLGRTAIRIAISCGHGKVVEALLDEYSSLSMKDQTILHYVCAYGDITLVRKLLRMGVNVDYTDSMGQTPLFYACRSGHLGVVKTLVTEFQADVTAQDKYGKTAAMVAAINGHTRVVEGLVRDYRISLLAKDHSGGTILHHACSGGNVECFRYIIETQKKITFSLVHYIDLRDSIGQTPLFYACKRGHIEMAVDLIHKFQADATARDNLGRTAAMVGILNGHYILWKDLVNLHIKDNKGQTVLHHACEAGNVDLVKNLIITKHGANISAQDDQNNTPLHKAASCGKQQVIVMLIENEIIGIRYKDHLGRTLLHIACTGNNVDLVKTLITRYKADIDCRDSQNNTPIHVAALAGSDEVVFTLLDDFKCDINDKGELGRTLLHSACIRGNLNLFRTLVVKYKADVSIKDAQSNTPLHVAASSGNRDIALVLLSKFQCDPNGLGHLGRTLLHSACIGGNSSLVQTLVDHYNTVPTSLLAVDFNGDTALHIAAALGHNDCLKVLLSHEALLGKTALDVTTEKTWPLLIAYINDIIYRQYDVIQESAKKRYAGAERITRIFVIGNPGAGKSTLIETLKRDGWFDYFRTVTESDVPPHTAGIIPSIYRSKQCGRILFYDFAGDPEYYSSHAAILENFASSKGGYNIFVIVVDLREDIRSIRRIINYWTLFIQNQSFPGKNLSFIVVGSHLDALSDQQKIQKSQKFRTICQQIKLSGSSHFMLNCCRPLSREATNILKHIISVTKDSPCYPLTLQSSLLLGLLEKDFSHVISCSIQTILSHIKDTGIALPILKDPLLSILSDLQDIGILMVIAPTHEGEEVQIVLNLSRLTNEVHQLLFSKQALDRLEAIDVDEGSSNPSFNIGIIPEELLFSENATSQSSRIIPLPKFITKKCLIQLQYCQEIHHEDIQAFQPVPYESTGSYLFFPALCTARKHEIALWNDPPEVKYSQGWLAQCTNHDDYFPPRFLHVLLLRLVFKFTLSTKPSASLPDYSVFQRRCCQMWSSGVFWSMHEGVKCIVELVRDSKAVVVFVKSNNDSPKNFTKYFNEVIACVKETQLDFCCHIKPEFFLLDSINESDYFNQSHMYRMTDVEHVLENPIDMEVIYSVAENKELKISRLQMLFTQVPDVISSEADDRGHQDQESNLSPSASHQVTEVEVQKSPKPSQDFSHSSTSCDYASCVSSLPPAMRPHLEYQLDWDNTYDRDLCEIARHMLGWDAELSCHLCLSKVDINDIKEDNSRAELRRRAALELWKSRQMQHATYGNLLQVFVNAGHSECAEALCELIKKKYKVATHFDSGVCKPKNPK